MRTHNHYFKDVSKLAEVDVYRVLELFKVTDQALGHAIKKLLVAGGRGAGKDMGRDVQEAIDTLTRRMEMWREDAAVDRAVLGANRVYDLLLPDDGYARKEARRFLEAHHPDLFAQLKIHENGLSRDAVQP